MNSPLANPKMSKCWVVLSTLCLMGALVSPVRAAGFPSIPVWVLQGGFQEQTQIIAPNIGCVRHIPVADSVLKAPRVLTLRFQRDPVAEARPDFGGYRVYRMINSPDSTHAQLIRRFSINEGSELTWSFSRVDPVSGQFKCGTSFTANDAIVSFVDPDSNGQFQKVCRRYDASNRCITPGDSIFKLVAPPGPHDGFLTWYSVTYEKRNTTDTDYEDLFIPDTLNNFARCAVAGVRNSCPNLNHKLRNLAGPVAPTAGPSADLEGVRVVPNPYRGNEVWDQPNGGEVHFLNLPRQATIKIFTAAGDLVRQIEHNDAINDFERWDLKSGNGAAVVSGIYLYKVSSGSFNFQGKFIVIR